MVGEKEPDQLGIVSPEENKETGEITLSQIKPKIESPENLPAVKKDPVIERRRKDAKDKKKTNIIPQKESNISTQIQPTLSKRIDLKHVDNDAIKVGDPRPKFEVPRTKKQQKYYEKHRANTAKKFCKYSTLRVPKPQPDKKMTLKIEVPSPEPSQAKVAPRKVTPTSSMLYPYPQTDSELKVKKPKSGIFINEKEAENADSNDDDYDSFDLVFSRKTRPKSKKRSKKRDGLEDILEGDEETDEGREKHEKKKKKKKKAKEYKEDEMKMGKRI